MTSHQRTIASRHLVSASLTCGLALWVAGCGGSSSNNGGPPAPAQKVSSVSPALAASSVATNTKLNAMFSGPMNQASITPATFTVTGPGSTSVAGSVSYLDQTRTATFAPSSTLAALTTFTATLTTGIRDAAGNPLGSAFSWTFTTGSTADTTAPTVAFTAPTRGQAGVAPNSKAIATFSESMDGSTITQSTFTLANGAAVSGTVLYAESGKSATFTPLQDLLPTSEYTATLSTQVRDLAGNAMSVAYVWTFTTGTVRDTTRPTVTSTNPADLATAVPTNKRVNATFSEAMDPQTITTLTYTLRGSDSALVSGTVSYDPQSKIATFVPVTNLAQNTTYTATVTTAAADVAANTLATDRVWSFTTGTINNNGQLPIDLRSAGLFVVLAGSEVASTGATILNGDLGLSPGSAVNGFPPGVVNGTQHVTDPAAAQAQLDLTTAYNEAQGRSTNPIAMPGNLGGLTLVPGLYKSGDGAQISGTGSNAILTLDAGGDSTAVWVFQMASTLQTDSGTSIVLAGGAQASNVFWAVGTSATLGTTSSFAGTIMADQTITLNTGAKLNGRALARIAAVNLDGSEVTLP